MYGFIPICSWIGAASFDRQVGTITPSGTAPLSNHLHGVTTSSSVFSSARNRTTADSDILKSPESRTLISRPARATCPYTVHVWKLQPALFNDSPIWPQSRFPSGVAPYRKMSSLFSSAGARSCANAALCSEVKNLGATLASSLTRSRFASAVCRSAAETLSSASISAFLDHRKARHPKNASAATARVTRRLPCTSLDGNTSLTAASRSSFPDSMSRPRTTVTAAIVASVSKRSARLPYSLAFLVGPFMRRRGRPSNITPIGLLFIFIAFAVYVVLSFFCQGRSGCPSWLRVDSLLQPVHQGAAWAQKAHHA